MEENATSVAIKTEIPPVEGFILFEETSSGKLREHARSEDIALITFLADGVCRAWPGVKFYIYSGITGKWYAYYKPIQGV